MTCGGAHVWSVKNSNANFVNACVCEATNSRREETTGQGADKLAPEKLQCGEAKVATPEQESIAASERDAQEIEVGKVSPSD